MGDFVDIHGRAIKTISQGGKLWVALEDIERTGFHLFKSQEFNNKHIDKELISDEFDLYMLEKAKDFYLHHKEHISEVEVLKCIESCRSNLSSKTRSDSNRNGFNGNPRSNNFNKINRNNSNENDRTMPNHFSKHNISTDSIASNKHNADDDLKKFTQNLGASNKSPSARGERHSRFSTSSTKSDDSHSGPAWLFKQPKPLATLQNDQIVIIGNERNGKFSLRTKDCYLTLKSVSGEANNCQVRSVNSPKKDALVLCNKENEEGLFRALIKEIKGNSADVEYLDYYESTTVPIKSLKTINETLCKFPITFISSPNLKGFENGQFSDKCRKYLEECAQQKTKFTVVLDNGSFDLKFINKSLLSDKLKELDSAEKMEKSRIMYADMTQPKINKGIDEYQLYYRNPDDITLLCVDTESIENLEMVVFSEWKDTKPYVPQKGEMCLGLYEEEWYRCLVCDTHDAEVIVTFVDYGNTEVLSTDAIRKFPEHLKKIPILGIKCKLIGINNVEEKSQLIQEIVVDGDIVEIDIKSINKDNECEIEIPVLKAKLDDYAF